MSREYRRGDGCAAAVLAAALVAGCASTPRVSPGPIDSLDHNSDLDDWSMSYSEIEKASARTCPRLVHPPLWRVEKDGRTSHMFGTRDGVNIGSVPESVIHAFHASKLVAVESVEAAKVKDPTRGKLGELLDRSTRARLYAVLGSVAAPAIDRLPARDVIRLLSLLYVDRHRVDKELEALARDMEKPVVGFQTPAELSVARHKWLGVRALEAIVASLTDRRALRDRTLADLADYCNGREPDRALDVRDLEQAFTPEELHRMEDDLVLARNRAWLPRLEDLFRHGDAFVLVGAPHLRGAGSLVELLQDGGYRVTRVE